VPVDALYPYYTGVQSYQDLPVILRDQIAHFSSITKTWRREMVSIVRWVGPRNAPS